MSSNKKVFFIPILVLIISTIAYAMFAASFNNYGSDNNRFVNLLDQYENINQDSILFIGDSQIREDIDCRIIESERTKCYNLGMAGILPIQIALQKDFITQTKPRLIILGASPLFFNEYINKNDDLYFFIGRKLGKIKPDEYLSNLLTEKEKELLYKNTWEKLLHKNKFFMPFYLGLIKQIFSTETQRNILNNFKDPYLFLQDQSFEELNKKIDDKNTMALFDIDNSQNRQIESFEYLIDSLHKNKGKIIIVQMPLNPLLKDKISDKSWKKYHKLLLDVAQENNVTLINLEEEFEEEEFIDLTHLNNKGRKRLSKEFKLNDDELYLGDIHII
ncbi:hypothetical protein ACFL0W_01490 [Nanoarchaeota archaeon]